MTAINRRSFFRFLAAIGVVGSGDFAFGAQPDPPPSVIARRRAIFALRTFNNLQVKHRARFLSLREMFDRSRTYLEYVNTKAGFVVFNEAAWLGGGDLVPGFQLVSQLASGDTAYTYFLVSRSDRSSYKTDQSGVIYEGLVSIDISAKDAQPDLIARGFSGTPFQPKEQLEQVTSPIGRAIAAATGFIFPVVSAEMRNACCTSDLPGACNGQCLSDCGEPKKGGCFCEDAPENCCNIGTGGNCNWCCKACKQLDPCNDPWCCDCTFFCI